MERTRRLLNRTQMKLGFICDKYELRKFIKEGMPHIGEGKAAMFDFRACQDWFAGKDIENDELGTYRAQKTNLLDLSEYDCCMIIGRLQGQIENILKSPDDVKSIKNTLNIALAESDIACAEALKSRNRRLSS